MKSKIYLISLQFSSKSRIEDIRTKVKAINMGSEEISLNLGNNNHSASQDYYNLRGK
jgi:hypothetical protein